MATDAWFHVQTLAPGVWQLTEPGHVCVWLVAGENRAALIDDLGARTLSVLHTPGHSPADLCFELVDEGLLFAGDTVNTGPVYVQNADSSVPQLRESLARLAARAARYRRVLCCHFLRTAVPPSYLAAQVAALDELLAGKVSLTPAVDCVGSAVDEASFDGFSFFVPVGWAPA